MRTLTVLFIGSALLFAETGKRDVMGYSGYNRAGLGGGVVAGATVGLRLGTHWGLEAEYGYLRHSREEPYRNRVVNLGGSLHQGTGNVLFHLMNGNLQPFLLAGAGVASYSTESPWAGAHTSTGPAGSAGGGVKWFPGKHFFLRPEGRYRYAGSEWRFGSHRLVSTWTMSLGAGYSW